MENRPFEDVSPIENGDFPAMLVYWRVPLFSTGPIFEATFTPGCAIGGSVVQGALPLQLSSYLAQLGPPTQQTYWITQLKWGLKKAPMFW